MLELFGKRHVIDHVVAELNSRQRDEIFKTYIANLLRYIAKGVGFDVSASYAELIQQATPHRYKKKEQSAEEIINNIRSKVGALQ